MASGQTLDTFTAAEGIPPASNYATQDTRNTIPVLDFDDTTQETIYFIGVLPRNYGGGGITVYITWACTSATSGTVGWDVSFEATGTDLDADSFATAQTITAATTSGTAGIETVTSVAITNGANIDNLAVGNRYRLRIRRDVANDTAVGDAELTSVELKEQ